MEADDYLDMPDLNVVDKLVTIPPRAMAIYRDIEAEFIATLDGGDVLTAPTNASAGMKCRQIANGAVYLSEDSRSKAHNFEELHNEKLDMLDELLEEIGEHPVLIAYEFQHDLHRISRRHLDWPCLTGMSGESLQYTIREFNAGNITRLLIQSSQAHGLNIQEGCHHLVWYGLTWNWEDYKQMVDRLYRQGQSATMVMVYRLLAEGTLDIQVASRLEEKMEEELRVKRAAAEKGREIRGA